ncbi:hypothetical protein [Flavobacterium lipolyticum]|uniref:Uncharacterized protein n=1 Tax=Flavobacterium lipolyticum TaxID=2893754 RepID=A0ABS8LY15_9FLAO|nr:hypothetical protein [Flavobacterium sp. F-126]MCC9016967.1 hypothetical protein [Flavobacterium sp. F-126]
MNYTLQQQRTDLAEACMMLEAKIEEMKIQKNILTNAFNSIDQNQENILESGSILAQEARSIMRKITTNF